MTKEDLLAHLTQQLGFQKGAWQRVIDDGRKLAQMKAHGTYEERGCSISAGGSDNRKRMTTLFQEELLRSIDQAYAEDARLGATVSEITKESLT